MKKRLGFDPAQQDSGGEEEAVAAGRAMRERQRARLEQVPELPDRYDPTSVRPPSPRSDPDAPPSKRRRVRLASTSDAEDTAPTQPDTTPFRLNSDSEAESTPHTYDPITQVVVDMLELEGPRVRRSHPVRPPVKAKKPPVEPSGPSHLGVALAAPTPRLTQRRFSSDDEEFPAPVETFPFGPAQTDQPPPCTLSASEGDETDEWSGPRLGLVRRGRGGGRTVRRHARTRRRLPANPFVEMEAEEGDDEESEAESESPPRCALPTQTLTTSHTSDEDSSDSSDSDDSLISAEDIFE